MDNLTNSGLVIKTLNLKGYGSLIDDLNYNFTQILQLPGFKSSQGAKGDIGDSQIGERGALWYFAKLESFNTMYDGTITSSSQITIDFVNVEYINDESRLISALGAEDLKLNDIIVLPSGSVIQLDQNDNEWVFSGITFEESNGVSKDEVIQLIEQYMSGNIGDSSVFEFINSHAKNVADNNTGLQQGSNSSLSSESILDPLVPGSDPGTNVSNYKFVTPVTGIANRNTNVLQIVGSALDYHDIVQQALNGSNAYAPSYLNTQALCVLQNNRNNGILLGYKGNSNGFRDFSRIYRSGEGLTLTSGYSPLDDEYSDIIVNNGYIQNRSPFYYGITAPSIILDGDISHNSISSDNENNNLSLGNSDGYVEMLNDTKLSKSGMQSADILSTDAQGILQNVFSILSDISDTENAVVNAEALYEFKTDIENDIQELQDSTVGLGDNAFIKQSIGDLSDGTTNFNNYTSFGFYVLGYPDVDETIGSIIAATNSPYAITADSVGLKVFVNRSLDDDTAAETLIQLATNINTTDDFSTTQRCMKYRYAFKNASQSYVWSNWICIVDGNYNITTGEGLDGGGTFQDGDINITHSDRIGQNKIATRDMNYVLSSLTTIDGKGHIEDLYTTNLDETYYNKETINNTEWENEGASLVGVSIEKPGDGGYNSPDFVPVFDHIFSDNVQDVLQDIDIAISDVYEEIESSSANDSFVVTAEKELFVYDINTLIFSGAGLDANSWLCTIDFKYNGNIDHDINFVVLRVVDDVAGSQIDLIHEGFDTVNLEANTYTKTFYIRDNSDIKFYMRSVTRTAANYIVRVNMQKINTVDRTSLV